jgi:hypothetical protein
MNASIILSLPKCAMDKLHKISEDTQFHDQIETNTRSVEITIFSLK